MAILSASGPAFPQGRKNGNPPDPTYAPDKAIDADPATFCCLLDDTLTGYSTTTIPANAAAPVTGHIVFDLGEAVLLSGLRLTGRQGGGAFNPKRVDVLAATDAPVLIAALEAKTTADHTPGITPLCKHTFSGLANGRSEDVFWDGVVTRYVALDVHSSYESGNVHHNFQIGEIAFHALPKPDQMRIGDRIPSVYERGIDLPETLLSTRKRLVALYGPSATDYPPGHVGKLWNEVRRDFPPKAHPLLEEVGTAWFADRGWFAESATIRFELSFSERMLEEMAKSRLSRRVTDSLRQALAELTRASPPPANRAWLDVSRLAARTFQLSKVIRSVDLAMADLGESFPSRYPLTELLRRLREQESDLVEIARRGPSFSAKALETLSQSLTALQREALVQKNPLLSPGEILFVKRYTYSPGWYYAEFMRASRFGGGLYVLSLPDGTVREVTPELRTGITDRFDLSFDGRHIVFGHKTAPGQGFRLYEVNTDGTGLRQVTVNPPDEKERIEKYWHPRLKSSGVYRHHTDDFHPCYLPDGDICFASTRCERGVLCAQDDSLSVNVLYRIAPDGSNLHMLSQGALSESTPSITNDGRVLYTRWEYVDKGVIAVQSLWAMWPDGSHSTEVYGNEIEFPPVLIHGRAVPGMNHRFVATATMHHPFAVGPILLLDTTRNIRTHDPIHSLTPRTSLSTDGVGGFPRGENYTHLRNGEWTADNVGPLFNEPYPLADPETGAGAGKYFLVTCNPDRSWNHPTAYGLYLLDAFGNRVPIFHDPTISCWQPFPLRPRSQPPVLPSTPSNRIVPGNDMAVVSLSDVYSGLDGVPRGSVKYLRVMEQIPRPWAARRFWPGDESLGQHAIVSMYSHIYVKILHGVVPVHPDGSAHFTLPTDRSIFLQALDENYMEVKRMRTFVNFQPGEVRSCIGCHEAHAAAPPVERPQAISFPPAAIQSQPGDSGPRPVGYMTDVQPILTKYCVSCHSGTTPKGKLDLSATLTTYFCRSYESIMRKKLVTYVQEFIGPQPRAQKTNVLPLPPYSLGSPASKLISVLRAGHHRVKLPPEDMIRLVTWADANGPYYGSYFGKRNIIYREDADFRPVPTLESAQGTPP